MTGGEKMQQADDMRDRFITEFAENYMEKLFYFCLKKTGDQFEAEDLTQDIALQIVTGLRGGTIPTSFSAWVWQIARNRYSRWAERKHNASESLTGYDIASYEIEDENDNVLCELIRTEELALLRRELAFIKSEYRSIVVAHYIENKRIREIASDLSLPENTVKSRLLRAREILKEGMDMAREFGIRSYKPEQVGFSNSCSRFGDNGQPWSILYHSMYKNIFLEAYGNPSTAEELSVELGIDLPYMEDELNYLTDQTFLIKKDNKYETAFPIIGKEVQEKIWDYNSRIAERLTNLFCMLVDDYTKACEAHGIAYFGKYAKYDDAKWALLMRAFDELAYPKYKGRFEYTRRPDNGSWDIVGYQEADTPYIPFVGQHGSDTSFSQYKFKYENIEDLTPVNLSPEESRTLIAVAKGEWENCDPILLEKLIEYGYVVKKDSSYEPTIVVFNNDKASEYWTSFSAAERSAITKTVEEIKSIISAANKFAFKITAESLPPMFKNDERMCYFACANNRMSRDIIFMQAIKDGWLKYDETTSRVVGAYLYI